ncbi:hypothetical protein QN277_022026 [Acacia crassicarpa]|uniref:Uncharacterized protein n=1 Tax=Acacia crassicarpa TaxID=499986 RepID=A0AAE1JGX9_9FABA|nr:hypothetical protein QN277_022026 [Acacia crassicarpa]
MTTKKNKSDDEVLVLPENKRSTSGYCIYLGPNPILWISRKQQVVSRFATEAEYRSTVALASNPALHSKTKHIELDVHFIREKVAAGIVTIGYVPSDYQVVDILTKPQLYSMFSYCRNKLNILAQDEVNNGEAR